MFMRTCAPCAALAIALAGAVFATNAAEAKGVRFVASNGHDSNTCQRKRPCRTLQRGIASAPDGGVVMVVDSAKYGSTVTIDKSITIDALGTRAAIDAIVVNAPGASVVLRGLLLNGTGLPANTNGVLISDAASVQIVACVIERMPSRGILADAVDSDVFVRDTVVRGNDGNGIRATNGSRVMVDESRFENNDESGISILGEVTIDRSVLAGNLFGLFVGSGATGRISNSVVVNNAIGLNNVGGTLLSRGNNTVSGNGTNTSGAITPLGGI